MLRPVFRHAITGTTLAATIRSVAQRNKLIRSHRQAGRYSQMLYAAQTTIDYRVNGGEVLTGTILKAQFRTHWVTDIHNPEIRKLHTSVNYIKVRVKGGGGTINLTLDDRGIVKRTICGGTDTYEFFEPMTESEQLRSKAIKLANAADVKNLSDEELGRMVRLVSTPSDTARFITTRTRSKKLIG